MELQNPNKNELILMKLIVQLQEKIKDIEDNYVDADAVSLIADRLELEMLERGFSPVEETNNEQNYE